MKFLVAGFCVWLMAFPAMAFGPCREQVKEFCKDLKPGEGRIQKCIEENADKFTGECKDHLTKMKEHLKEVKEECAEDSDSLCAGKEKKELMHCLRENKEKLSTECKASIKDLKKMRKKH